MRATPLLLVLAACGGPPEDRPPPPIDPLESLGAAGDHAVGYRVLDLPYLEPVTATERVLRVAIWYPSSDSDGVDTKYQGIFDAPGVWADATVAEGTFPLMIFSHGHQGYAEVSGFLVSHFASRGWVVVAPEHTGNTSFDSATRETEIYFQRPLDVSATLDHFEDLPADDPLAGHVTSPVIGMGHSFGGYTLFALGGAEYDVDHLAAACSSGTGPDEFCSTWMPDYEPVFGGGFLDPRFDAHIAMAPGDYGLYGAGLGEVQRPVLHLSGGLDPRTPDSDAIFAALRGEDDLRVHITSGGHQTFTDYSGILEDFEGLIDAEEGFRIVKIYATAFADGFLGDEIGAPVLSGELEVSPEVELSTH